MIADLRAGQPVGRAREVPPPEEAGSHTVSPAVPTLTQGACGCRPFLASAIFLIAHMMSPPQAPPIRAAMITVEVAGVLFIAANGSTTR